MPWMLRPACGGSDLGPSNSPSRGAEVEAAATDSWEMAFAANLGTASGAPLSGTGAGVARAVPASAAAAGGGDDGDDDEVMVSVQGVSVPIGAVTEDDQGRMSAEEHARYFELCQDYM